MLGRRPARQPGTASPRRVRAAPRFLWVDGTGSKPTGPLRGAAAGEFAKTPTWLQGEMLRPHE